MYTLDEIQNRVQEAIDAYNATASFDAQIARVFLFGSYAEGLQTEKSDIDLLVKFNAPVVSFFSLARVLDAMERHLDAPVDIVQDPLPHDALLDIKKRIPLYEAA